jgi:hypothetical protein
MRMDPNELIGPVERGWPLDGRAADWVLDLEAGHFGELRLGMGYRDVVQLLLYGDGHPGMTPRGPAAVRLRLDFDECEEISEDDDAEVEFLTDIELDWDELSDGERAPLQPLIHLPGKEAISCASLTLSDLEEVFGRPTLAEIFDEEEDQWLLEWRRDGFFVIAFTDHGSLRSAGIASISLAPDPPLVLVT